MLHEVRADIDTRFTDSPLGKLAELDTKADSMASEIVKDAEKDIPVSVTVVRDRFADSPLGRLAELDTKAYGTAGEIIKDSVKDIPTSVPVVRDPFADSSLGRLAESLEKNPEENASNTGLAVLTDSPTTLPAWTDTWPRAQMQELPVSAADVAAKALVKTGVLQDEIYYGAEADGKNTLGLKEISMRRVNPENAEANTRSHIGFAGEVISTAKENMQSQVEEKGITTYRADDRPDLYPKNDQYVDKIRVNDATGEVVDTIQCKFIGKDGESCLNKLAGKKCDKYFNDGKVTKVEIPSEFYDEIRNNNLIGKKIADLEQQLAHVKAEGKTEVATQLEKRIERYHKIDQMLERSNTSLEEARFGYEHPELYMVKLEAAKIFPKSHEVGKQVGLSAAGLTAVLSTVDNVQKTLSGEISAKEALADIAQDTTKAGLLGYGAGFLTSAAGEVMLSSGNELIQTAANAGVPGAVIAVGVSSWDAIVEYAKGERSGKELVYTMGENTSGIAGSMLGSAAAGAAVGSIVPGAGTLVGFGAGLVGGMVGYATTSTAYKIAVEQGAKGAHILGKKAERIAEDTLLTIKTQMPDKLDSFRSAFNRFNVENKIPFRV